MSPTTPALLSGVRVVDMSDGLGESCGRYLAELGADVVLVEPPGGSRARHAAPLAPSGASVHFATHHADKRGVQVDLTIEAGRHELLDLLGRADIWIESTAPGTLAALGLPVAKVMEAAPHLVVVSVTHFGQTGPYRDLAGADLVHLALAGVVSRSGLGGRPPLPPPGSLADECASMQAAWAAVLAHWQRLETGLGDHIDVSVYEATAQVLDPPLGSVGTALAGGSAMDGGSGRPARATYPVYACADGHVRLVTLATPQWHHLRAWLGEPPELMDPGLDTVQGRRDRAEHIDHLIGELLAPLPVDVVVAEAQRRGIPAAAVLSLGDVLASEHFRVRSALVDAEIAPGVRARVPNGVVEVDGQRAARRVRAPEVGEHLVADVVAGWALPGPPPEVVVDRRPLVGLRVLDLGIIVMGGEAGRLLADQGAEVIKVENRQHPDGARAAIPGLMSPSFAAGQRGKLGFGVDLRTPDGVAVLERLVMESDVLLENFKPGTMEALGLGWDRLHALNPALVMTSSSALGSSGPWRRWMGYGPLVRCTTGLSQLWRYPDREDGYCDGTTVFPDHLAARIVCTAALAGLVRRRATGLGSHIECAQAEVILAVLADHLVLESLHPGSAGAPGHVIADAPWGIYPCAGDDAWCAVVTRHDRDWEALVAAVGPPPLDPRVVGTPTGRLEHRDQLDRWLGRWTASRSPDEVMEALQRVGVPAGAVRSVQALPEDPHLRARGFAAELHQPGLVDPVLVETGPAHALRIPTPELRPAPLAGEHTREICRRVLGLADAEVDRLIAADVLQEPGEGVEEGRGVPLCRP